MPAPKKKATTKAQARATTKPKPPDASPAMLNITTLAKELNFTKQNASKEIKKLEAAGLLTSPDIIRSGRTVRVNPVAFAAARAHAQARATDTDRPPAQDQDQPRLAPVQSGPDYGQMNAAKVGFQAKLAELEYRKKTGEVIDRAETLDALTTAARRIRQAIDTIPTMADDIAALITEDGAADPIAIRKLLKSRCRDLEQTTADALLSIAAEEDQSIAS